MVVSGSVSSFMGRWFWFLRTFVVVVLVYWGCFEYEGFWRCLVWWSEHFLFFFVLSVFKRGRAKRKGDRGKVV